MKENWRFRKEVKGYFFFPWGVNFVDNKRVEVRLGCMDDLLGGCGCVGWVGVDIHRRVHLPNT